MSGFTITIDAGSLNAFLAEMQDRIKNLTPAMRAFGEYMLLVTREERFDKQQSPSGAKWEELNPDYAEEKQSEVGFSHPILVKYNILRNQIHYSARQDGVTISPPMAAEHYAAVHQFGATIRPVNAKALVFPLGGKMVFAKEVTIPARPYLGVNEQDVEEVRETILDFLFPDRT